MRIEPRLITGLLVLALGAIPLVSGADQISRNEVATGIPGLYYDISCSSVTPGSYYWIYFVKNESSHSITFQYRYSDQTVGNAGWLTKTFRGSSTYNGITSNGDREEFTWSSAVACSSGNGPLIIQAGSN